MAALERFIHDDRAPYPALVKAALAHVQFETIHPFLDGNGRIGRLLIALLLHDSGVLSQPLLYLSLYFKQHRAEYYRLLDLVRADGDWEAWLDFFLEAVAEAARGGRHGTAPCHAVRGRQRAGTVARAVRRDGPARARRLARPAADHDQRCLPARRHDVPDGDEGHGDAGRSRHRPRAHEPAAQPRIRLSALSGGPERRNRTIVTTWRSWSTMMTSARRLRSRSRRRRAKILSALSKSSRAIRRVMAIVGRILDVHSKEGELYESGDESS